MENRITWFLAGLFSLGLVIGFIYVIDQLENAFQPNGADIRESVEKDKLQERFDEAINNGEVENLSL